MDYGIKNRLRLALWIYSLPACRSLWKSLPSASSEIRQDIAGIDTWRVDTANLPLWTDPPTALGWYGQSTFARAPRLWASKNNRPRPRARKIRLERGEP
jgi:hypothetical protein